MHQCLELAKIAQGNTSPNPLVGAVIVKDNRIIAQGHHKQAGLDHAEKDALKNATENVKGATLYCSLEPCCHTNKRTPPCTDAIIEAGISEVIIGSIDPNPEVAGKGIEKLKSSGIKVQSGILKNECDELNEVFFVNMQKKRPFFHLKWAQTLDGFIATKSGDSKWITGEEARINVHHERARYDAILVGAETLRADNPALTIRIPGRDISCKKRIVLSASRNLPKDALVFTDPFKDQTFVIECDILDLPTKLWEMGIRSVYVEGGAKIHTALLQVGLVDRLSVYIAPKLLGAGVNVLNDLNIELMNEALSFENCQTCSFGADQMLSIKVTF